MATSKPYQLRLVGDYQFDEVASALQKCIRRNMEYEACHWAFIMHESNYYNYVWKRLAIIASEDVGNANPEAAILVSTLQSSYKQAISSQNRTKNDALVFIFQAIIYLCRSPKTREADSLVNLIRVKYEQGEIMEIPEFALDFHTRRGRAKLGNWQDGTQDEIDHRHRLWFDKYSKIDPDAGDDKYVAELRKLKRAE